MLYIEGILRLYASGNDMYSSNYFKSVDEFKTLIKTDRFYLLGWGIVNHSPTVVTLDTVKMWHEIDNLDWTLDVNCIILGGYKQEWVVDNPPIPPQFGWKNDHEREDMSRIQTRYLRVYDHTAPRYVYLDAAMDDVKVVVEDGSKDLILHQPVHTFAAKSSVYFVNGFCCRPTVSGRAPYGEIVTLDNAASYCANQTDRNRGIVILDFEKSSEVEYMDVDVDQEGNISFSPDIDIYNTSMLLVVDGRLFCPDEFDVYPNGKVILKKEAYKAEYICDRLVCENKFIGRTDSLACAPTRNVEAKLESSLKNYPNTFMIVFKHKGLKATRHSSVQIINKDNLGQITFHGSSHGLLFDQATRSVFSFLRTENDNDFYCANTTRPLKWHEMIAYISLDTPLEIWAKHNNDMSVHASLHDRHPVQGTGLLLRPKYTMLDFAFEG